MDDNQERKDFSSTESDSQLSADEETLLDQLGITGAARRKFLGQSMAALLGTFAFHLLAKEEAFATPAAAHPRPARAASPALLAANSWGKAWQPCSAPSPSTCWLKRRPLPRSPRNPTPYSPRPPRSKTPLRAFLKSAAAHH